MTEYAQADGGTVAQCHRPALHPDRVWPRLELHCDTPEHHAPLADPPAPRHAGANADVLLSPAGTAPYAAGLAGLASGAYDAPGGPDLAADLADAQRVADAAGARLDAARAVMRDAVADSTAAQNAYTAAVGVLGEVRKLAEAAPLPLDDIPAPALPDARAIRIMVTELRDEWDHRAGKLAGSDHQMAETVTAVLGDVLAYAEGEL